MKTVMASSKDNMISKYWALGRDIFYRYSTFGGTTNFTRSAGFATVSLIASIATFQLSIIRTDISESGISLLSVLMILVFILGVIHYTIKAAKRTTDSEFHRKRGLSKVIAIYILIGSIEVLLLYGAGSLIFPDSYIFELTFTEGLLGLAMTLLFALAIAGANYSSLSKEYPSLQEVLTRFREESNEKLDSIENEIEGIGHVPRSETNRIIESLQNPDDLDNTIVRGRGGVGKSGILKRVCDECNHTILFIDASVHSLISSESALTDELKLKASLGRCIRQVSANRPLIVVFDQLDDTDRSSGREYSDIISSTAETGNVGTIIACRSYELNNYDEFQTLTESGLFDNDIEVKTLSKTQVKTHLEELGVNSPSRDLIELCEEIEYLDVVARLIAEGSNLENVNEQVAVWEEYRELLAEDHPSDDRLRGNRVIERAEEHAVNTTESGNSTFSVNQTQWTDRELISVGAIQRVDISRRQNVFRFRHQQFQLYLYARSKVDNAEDEENLFRDTVESLDETINTDVVKWMFAIYTDREAEFPGDTDDFLEEVLDEDGFEFYWASKIVDVVKKWDANENPIVTETVINKLESREDLYNYFFDGNTDPSWTHAFNETGRFQNPPGHLLGHLQEIANQYPELVSRILRENIGYFDRNDQTAAVSIIQELPIEYKADLYDVIKEGLDESEPQLDMYYSRSAEFTEDLVNGDFFDEALELIDLLLSIRLEAEPDGHNDDIMGSYYLTSLFEEGTLERLVQNRPNQAVELFEEKLRDAAESRAEDRGGEVTIFYHRSVSSFRIETNDRNQPFELFLGFLREAVDIWSENTDIKDQRRKIEEYLNDNVILRGFGFYLLRKHCDRHSDLVADILLQEQNYGDALLKKEFNLLLKHGFEVLTEDQQQAVIEVITSVPIRDSFEQIAEERQEEFDDMSVEEIVEQYSSRWIRDRLWPIRDDLPEEASERLSDLVGRFEDEPEDPETPAVRGGFVSYESPEPEERLQDRSPEDLINFCIEEPFEEEEWYESEEVVERGRRGTAERVAEIILEDPEQYASEIPRLTEAAHSYATHFLNQLRDRMEEEPEILDGLLFREALWELSEDIVSNIEEWPKNTRKRVGWVIRDGLGDENLYRFFLSEGERVKEIIFILLEDPDPNIERDRPPEGYAGHNDPSHTALNTVRPVALDALIIYARRKSDGDGSELEPQIYDKLEEKLDDVSLGVHSVFGRRLLHLWPIDQEWVINHLPEIFPRSQSRRDIQKFTASWDSYVAFNPAHPDVFPELRQYYFHAIDLVAEGENTDTINADQRLAGHLVANYLYGYDLEEWSDSLLAYLYDRGEPDLARQAAWNLWKWGDEQDEDDSYDKWNKVRSLWEKRLDQVGEDETYAEEIIWYVRWLNHVRNRVELPEVEGLLRSSLNHIGDDRRKRRAWLELETYLSKQSSNYTGSAVALLYTLVMNFDRPYTQQFNDDVAAILRPAFEEYQMGDSVYNQAFEIAQDYASDDDSEAQEFLDEVV